MYRLLLSLVSPNAIDLRLAIRDSPEATQELIYILENLCFQITYIQVSPVDQCCFIKVGKSINYQTDEIAIGHRFETQRQLGERVFRKKPSSPPSPPYLPWLVFKLTF